MSHFPGTSGHRSSSSRYAIVQRHSATRVRFAVDQNGRPILPQAGNYEFEDLQSSAQVPSASERKTIANHTRSHGPIANYDNRHPTSSAGRSTAHSSTGAPVQDASRQCETVLVGPPGRRRRVLTIPLGHTHGAPETCRNGGERYSSSLQRIFDVKRAAREAMEKQEQEKQEKEKQEKEKQEQEKQEKEKQEKKKKKQERNKKRQAALTQAQTPHASSSQRFRDHERALHPRGRVFPSGYHPRDIENDRESWEDVPPSNYGDDESDDDYVPTNTKSM